MGKNVSKANAKQKERMANALELNFGNITRAAKMARIAVRTHYRWLQEDIEYAERTENIKDIAYRSIKDNLLGLALKKAENGDSAVLNKMLGIFFKHLPDEIRVLNRFNNVPLRVLIKPVSRAMEFAPEEFREQE